MNFVEELRWRGMLHDMMPGSEEQLQREMTAGYIGFDPTADSLGIGNMVQVMTLLHFQRCGHKPIALVGGATGMVGDPSGKSAERNLLDEEALRHNQNCQQKQLEKFLDFESGENAAEIVNNYDWFKEMSFLEFIRDVGKHITVNYMMAKDSVQNRLQSGLSFTEFSYQLVQGYDFYWLNRHKGVKVQLGGSDQWGNIVTGTELIRRKGGGDAFALTTKLITKADGSKFGKSEGGNLWLDRNRTSPYQLYQYFFNTADEDAARLIRIFTLKGREEIEALEAEHDTNRGAKLLQRELAAAVTTRVHAAEDTQRAEEASQILFSKQATEILKRTEESVVLELFADVPQGTVSRSEVEAGMGIQELLAAKSGFLPSNSEARRALKENSVSLNKQKVQDGYTVTLEDLIGGRYLLLQRGKKKQFLVRVK